VPDTISITLAFIGLTNINDATNYVQESPGNNKKKKEALTWINICHILSSVNCCCFSFKEWKCSPSGTPSMSSMTMYNLSST